MLTAEVYRSRKIYDLGMRIHHLNCQIDHVDRSKQENFPKYWDLCNKRDDLIRERDEIESRSLPS